MFPFSATVHQRNVAATAAAVVVVVSAGALYVDSFVKPAVADQIVRAAVEIVGTYCTSGLGGSRQISLVQQKRQWRNGTKDKKEGSKLMS